MNKVFVILILILNPQCVSHDIERERAPTSIALIVVTKYYTAERDELTCQANVTS